MKDDEVKIEKDPETLDDSVVAEENFAETVKKLREKLKVSEKQAKEYLDGWQRERAQFVNLRKQDEKDKQEFAKSANERLAKELIPVLDSFNMAMANKETWEKVDKNWRAGVEYIFGQLMKVLTDHGVVEINPMGEKFDHAKHEAVGYEPVEDKSKENLILTVVQKGYSLNGKILKAAKVIVGEHKE